MANSVNIKFGITAVTDSLINLTDDKTAKRVIYAHPDFVVKTVIASDSDTEIGVIQGGDYNGKNYRKLYRKTILWDFGDGFKEEGITSSHVYTRPGKYKIKATFFDIDRKAYEDEHYVYVVVKEVIPTEIRFRGEQKKSVRCSEMVKLTDLDATVSKNFSKPFPVSPKRIDKYINKERSYNEVIADGGNFFHLKEYYTFLQKEKVYKNNYRTVYEEIYQPVEQYNPEYKEVYTRFFEKDGKVAIEGYMVSSISETFELLYLDPNEEFTDEPTVEQYKILEIKSRFSEDGMTFTGWWGGIEVFYRTDFDKTVYNTVSFIFDVDMTALDENVAKTGAPYVNILPMGMKFDIFSNLYSETTYHLTVDGFIDEESDLSKPVSISPKLFDSLTKNYDAPFFVIPVCKGECGYYSPKDLTISGISSYSLGENDSVLFDDTTTGWSFYKHLLLRLKTKLSMVLVFNGEEFLIEVSDLNSDVVVPKEKMEREDFPRLLEAYLPHKMFDGAVEAKSFLTNVLTNGDTFDYILTRSDSFLDDTINHKSCYIANLISVLKSMGEDIAEFETSDFNGVNEVRDFARIVSMNHTDLVGHIVDKPFEIFYNSDIDRGKNVGEAVSALDVLQFKDGYITSFGKNGKMKALKSDYRTNKLIIRDGYTKEIRMVDLYPLLGNGSGELSIASYDESWGWCLSLPKEFAEDSSDFSKRGAIIDRYYTFFLLNPVVEKERVGSFLEESTISPDVEGEATWKSQRGIVFKVLDKIIKEKMLYDNTDKELESKWKRVSP